MRKSRLKSIEKKKERKLLEKEEAEEALISVLQDRQERLENLQKKQQRRRKNRKKPVLSFDDSIEATEITAKEDAGSDEINVKQPDSSFVSNRQRQFQSRYPLSIYGRKFLREQKESRAPIVGFADLVRAKIGDNTELSPEEKLARLHKIRTKPFPIVESAYH